MNNVDGNLAALAVYEKEQDALAQLEEFISNRVDDMFGEVRAGKFDPERLLQLQIIQFENNGEVDNYYRDLLKSDSDNYYNASLQCKAATNFADNFYNCEHVQTQMKEWAEEDLNQEAEDNCNESACEARDDEF